MTPAIVVVAAMVAAFALLLWHLRRGIAAADLDDDSREWLADLSRPPSRAEKRRGRAYLETALGHTYVPVRRHHGRRA